MHNTRIFKHGESNYEITVGSIDTKKSKQIKYKGATFNLKYGEFQHYLKEVVKNL